MARKAALIVYLGPSIALPTVQRIIGERATLAHFEGDSEQFRLALRTAEGLIDASLMVRLNASLLDRARNLRAVTCAGTGSDHIDGPFLSSRGIMFSSLRDNTALLEEFTGAAELSWALLMACGRRLVEASQDVLAGHWRREQFATAALRSKTLGLIGCGRLGRQVALYGEAFGMRVTGYDPLVDPWPQGIERRTFDDLIEGSDYISIHVHLSPETRGMLSEDEFRRMRPGTILINTSRGAVIDEKALIDALEDGQLFAAGLDVLTNEPPAMSDAITQCARDNPRLILTPHYGGFTTDAVCASVAHSTEKLLTFLQATK
ncbi:MAG TPA: NAD(P)-dependent oxidoreductase [Actinomycetota bacterium]|nr:NAD(P)-dependent oxidoreductase [Actinomycetota bacterium]